MDFLDLIFPLLIILGPALFKSANDKKKIEKKKPKKMYNDNKDVSEKQMVHKVPKYNEQNNRRQKSIEERRITKRNLNKNEKSYIDEEKNINEERNIREEEKIKEIKSRRKNYADREEYLTKMKNIRNKRDEEKMISNRNQKTSIQIDDIRNEEIGSEDINLKFNKKQLVEGIILSEILSKPKALEKRR